MNRRQFLGAAAGAAFASANSARGSLRGPTRARRDYAPRAAQAQKFLARPNILHITVDQMRFDVLGANGNPICRTPALDKLAAEGVNFLRAYTCIGICSPARASLLTGRLPHHHGILTNTHANDAVRLELPRGEPSLADILRRAGYNTGHVGKWHVGRSNDPRRHGFRDSKMLLPGWGQYTEKIPLADESALRLPLSGAPVHARAEIPPERSRTYRIADAAIELLERYAADAARGTPFFLRVDWSEPHWPHYVPEPFDSMYNPRDIPPWPNAQDAFANKPYANHRLREQWGVGDVPWAEWARLVARYYAAITELDASIGRLLDALRRLGLEENTVVVFCADHGDLTGSHGLFNKGPVMYEEIYRIPLIVRWPQGALRGARCEEMVHLHDLMPTLLEAARIEPPENLDGRSLLPLLRGHLPDDWYTECFCEYHGSELGLYSQRMVVTKTHKLVFNIPDRNELYDLQNDPHELNNVYDDPAYAEVRRELAERLIAWLEGTGDMMDRWGPVVLRAAK